MDDEQDPLDQELARLAGSLRSGDHIIACLQLAELALRLDHYIYREERALSLAAGRRDATAPSLLAKLQIEHACMRRLVASIAIALDQADDRRGLELVGKLRSVLLLHLVKEDRLARAIAAGPAC